MLPEETLNRTLRQKKLTLSTAESCTGGAIAAKITKIPHSSEYFLGSVVSYSNKMKEDLLDVSPDLIKKYGAVSPEVAEAMWEGIVSLTGSDYAIAVTGIAGPAGGTLEKPVGTVWAAVGKKGQKPKVWNLHASGDRAAIIESTAAHALVQLLEIIDAEYS